MTTANGRAAPHFRHEAMLYAGVDDLVQRLVPVIERALAAEEPILVAVDAARIERLRDHLDGSSGAVLWTDIRELGRNPARIIPVWRRFVATHGSRGHLWGVGEPVWAGRSPAELEEAQLHEELLNVAFAGASDFTLLCPYDTEGLAPLVVREAHRSHPYVGGARGPGTAAPTPLPTGPDDPDSGRASAVVEVALHQISGSGLEAFLREAAPGLDPRQVTDLAIAVSAVTAHLRRPGGRSRLRVWGEASGVVAEIDGLTGVADALAGREWPPPMEGAARGLWLANQLCDLVQVRGLGSGTVVRLQLGRSETA